MDLWNMITSLLPMVAPYVPTSALAVVGSIALAGTKLSKPDSQVSTKSGQIFQMILKLGGANFGKAQNKD